MISIRKGTFETNSSSTHSICICREDRGINIPEKIEMNLKDYEFGWEFDKYYTTEEKLAYIIFGILDTTRELKDTTEKLDKLLSMIKEWVNVIKISGLAIKIFSEYGGIAYLDVEESGYGYVDHGNELYELVDALLEDKELLKRYLFSTDSFILTGNDNSDETNEIKVDYPYDEFWKGN